MKHGRLMRIICALIACILILPGMAMAEQTAQSGESGTLRVLLKSLGDISSMNLTVAGSYSLNADPSFRFAENASLNAAAVNGEVWLSSGGMALNMGESVTLTRHMADGENGLYIDGSPRGKLYCGSLRLTASGSVLKPVLLIDLEEYLYGVVPYEMSDSFPMEALKAQAVAARTYALQRRSVRTEQDYDVVDTTADQVFMGFDPSYVNAIAAVDATKGLCGLYKGGYATCDYTASNGGQTAMAHDVLNKDIDDGYLAVTDDPYDLENEKSMVKSLTLRADAYGLPDLIAQEMKASAAERLGAMGFSEETADIFLDEIVSIVPHTPLFGEPNRTYQYLTVTFRISACPMEAVYTKPTNLDRIHALFGRNTFTPELLGYEAGDPVVVEEEFSCEIGVYDQLKDDLNMQISYIDCELATVREQQGAECMEYVIELRRYGHGAGMSQRGAQQMAGQHGKTCQEILSFYYPGLTFETRSFETETLPSLGSLPSGVSLQGEGTKEAPLPELQAGERYARIVLANDWSTLNLRASASTEAAILTALNNGVRVIVMDEADGWAHVKTASTEGYVSSQYLAME